MKNFQLQARTSQPKFNKTASTMMHTNHRNSGLLFGRVQRSQKRLNSTIQIQSPLKSKFQRVEQSSAHHFSWNKWKINSFPIVSETFKKQLTMKIQKENQCNDESRAGDSTEIKLRHKIRQVLKLKKEIKVASQNNKLIKIIEDFQQNKINSFFDQLQQLLHSDSS